jgi:hypothetical protein
MAIFSGLRFVFVIVYEILGYFHVNREPLLGVSFPMGPIVIPHVSFDVGLWNLMSNMGMLLAVHFWCLDKLSSVFKK